MLTTRFHRNTVQDRRDYPLFVARRVSEPPQGGGSPQIGGARTGKRPGIERGKDPGPDNRCRSRIPSTNPTCEQAIPATARGCMLVELQALRVANKRPKARAGWEIKALPPTSGRGYTRSCIRTSEDFPSTHFGLVGRAKRRRVAPRLGKQRVISQELSPISVLPNKSRCTPRQAYKSLAIDTRNNHPQNRRINSRGG